MKASEVSRKITCLPAAASYNAADERADNIIGSRIAAARRSAGLTLDGLSARLAEAGVSIQRQGISKWETGAAVPNAYQLLALCRVLGVDNAADYFCRFAEKPVLNEEGRRKVSEYRDDLIASGRYSPAAAVITYITMPVSSLPVSAGPGQFLDSDSFEQLQVPADSVPQGAEFGIRISGDSMEPAYHHGDIAWVRRTARLNEGDTGVFVYDGSGYIKKYGLRIPEENEAEAFADSTGNVAAQPVLISLNPAYPPKYVSPYTDFAVIGRVLN